MESSSLWNLVFGSLVSINVGALLYGLRLFVELYGRVSALESLADHLRRMEGRIDKLMDSVQKILVELAEVRR